MMNTITSLVIGMLMTLTLVIEIPVRTCSSSDDVLGGAWE